MREILPELLEPVFYAALVSVLAVVGVSAELLGLAGLAGGVDASSLWYVYIGGVGIAAAVVVARRRLLPVLARGA